MDNHLWLIWFSSGVFFCLIQGVNNERPDKFAGIESGISQGRSKRAGRDCGVSPWSLWFPCRKTCGTDVYQFRMRQHLSQSTGNGKPCKEFPIRDKRLCDIPSCEEAVPEVRCDDSPWSEWSGCDSPCEGKRSRKRTVRTQHSGGRSCSETSETEYQDCGGPCSKDCVVSEWYQWGQCSVSCGEAIRSRTRDIIREAEHGGKPCTYSPLKETDVCYDSPVCEPNCDVSEWSSWSECTVSCGECIQKRSRYYTGFDNDECHKLGYFDLSEIKSMYLDDCWEEKPTSNDCVLTDWSDWSPCSATCGKAFQFASREVVADALNNGISCSDSDVQRQRVCNVPAECEDEYDAEDCILSDWSTWTVCSATCGDSFRVRTKTPLREARYGGMSCDSVDMKQEQQCPTTACVPGGAFSIQSTFSGSLILMMTLLLTLAFSANL